LSSTVAKLWVFVVKIIDAVNPLDLLLFFPTKSLDFLLETYNYTLFIFKQISNI